MLNKLEVRLAIVIKYGSVLNFAKKRGTSHTNINNYIEIFVGEKSKPKWNRKDAKYHYVSFEREIKGLLKEKEKLIEDIAKKVKLNKQKVEEVISAYLEKIEKITKKEDKHV